MTDRLSSRGARECDAAIPGIPGIASSLLLLAMTSTAFCTAASAQTADVPAELWDRPRSAETVCGVESVKGAVGALISRPEARLVIHHSSGQEPLLYAEELRSWLGALAIDTRRIALRSDLESGSPLKIEVVQ
jgi:hypothetical protein